MDSGSNPVVKVVSNMSAFAAIHSDGAVTTWGFSEFGGDSQSIQANLEKCLGYLAKVSKHWFGFCCFERRWFSYYLGNNLDGGNSSGVSSLIDGSVNVVSIFSTTSAFAALREDGSVITWGDQNSGGNNGDVALK